MFMESFENSDRQQQRRKSRQQAMRRMERAASAYLDDAGGPTPAAMEAPGGDDFSFEPVARPGGAASPPPPSGVAAASDFLRETQRQHRSALRRSVNSRSRSGGRSPPSSPQFSVASKMTLSKLKGRIENVNARNFLWDENSMASGRSGAVNLHDIKHSLGRRREGRGADDGGGAAGGGAWSLLPPLWGGGAGAGADAESVGSSRYRDREGERLLDLASERLNASGPGASSGASPGAGLFVENMEVLKEEEDDGECIVGEVAEEGGGAGERGQERRVFLGADGTLSYNNRRYSPDGEDYARRRMMNQYRRTFKKPCIVGIVAVAIVGIVYGVHGLYSKRPGASFEGPSSDSNGAWSGELAADDDWADASVAGEGGAAAETRGEPTEEERTAAAEAAANVEETPGGTWHKEALPSLAGPNAEGGSAPAGAEPLSPEHKERFDHLRYTLVNKGASPPEVFLDVRSAQYAALVWLTKDDPRRLDPESTYLTQRYGLATLWFATTKGGSQWHVPAKLVPRDRYGEEEAADEEDQPYDDEGGGDGGEDDGRLDDDDGDDGIDHYAEYDDPDDPDDPDEWPQRRLVGDRDLPARDDAAWFRQRKWLSAEGVCGWEGVTCHPHQDGEARNGDDDGDVQRLELRRNNLKGLVPEEVHRTLPYLTVLDLSDNGLAGTLSYELGNMKKLETLNLTLNNIAGPLPSSIGELASLKELHAADNLLGDAIPHAIGGLSNLRRLDLSGNTLKGTIPYEIGKLTQLSSMDLSHNFLAGPLPHEVSELKALVSLDVSHNELGGPMISELSQVKHLETLRLNDNHFSGEVPTEVGSLLHLEELHLSNNDFQGTLPGEISNLGVLDVLHIANNHFHGEFPPEWTSMAGLRELDASSNELNGEIPIFVDGMKNLHLLNLARNDFSSTIPSELGRLYKLEYLYLDGNEFTGGVPGEFGELTDLRGMALHNNYLTGQVDDRVCRLYEELFLTQLSVDCGGEMPDVFCDCCMCHDHEPIVHLGEP